MFKFYNTVLIRITDPFFFGTVITLCCIAVMYTDLRKDSDL